MNTRVGSFVLFLVFAVLGTSEADDHGFTAKAVVLYELKQTDAALQAWQTAIDLQPNQWDTLWNLGTKAAQNGRPEQARWTGPTPIVIGNRGAPVPL